MIRIYLVLFASVFFVSKTYAFRLEPWFENLNQRAARLLKEEKFAEAEKTFTRDDWKAVASYRGKNFNIASEQFKHLGGELGFYNQGNALAYLGQFQEAIAAYDKAIKLNPKHADAIYNRDLLKKLLEENKNNQDQNQQDQNKKEQDQNKSEQDQNKNEQNQEQDQKEKEQQQNKSGQAEKEQNQDKQNSDKRPQDTEHKGQDQSKSEQEKEQALRLIPDDPGGLLREKFWRDHWRRLKKEQS